MRDINLIVIHCTASKEGVELSVADIDKMHKAKGWRGIGYHYVIGLDGVPRLGRPVQEVGAHVKGHNEDSIGIVYVGGLDANGKPKDTRTAAQKKGLVELLKMLKVQFKDAVICGHRDLSPDKDGDGVVEKHEWLKACPCFDAKEEYKGV